MALYIAPRVAQFIWKHQLTHNLMQFALPTHGTYKLFYPSFRHMPRYNIVIELFSPVSTIWERTHRTVVSVGLFKALPHCLKLLACGDCL